MNNYVIITDSSCDLPASLADELGVKVLQLEVNIEGERTKFNNEIDIKDFYATLRTKKAVTTSAVNIDRFIDVFERELARLLLNDAADGTAGNGGMVCAGI